MSYETRLVDFKILKDLRSYKEARELVKAFELLRLFLPINIVRTFTSAVPCETTWHLSLSISRVCLITVYWVLLLRFDLFSGHWQVFKHPFTFGCRAQHTFVNRRQSACSESILAIQLTVLGRTSGEDPFLLALHHCYCVPNK